MKRTMLFAFVLCFGMALSAQNIPEVIGPTAGKVIKVDHRSGGRTINPFVNQEVSMLSNKGMLDPNETELGETFYDLQSNASINNRFWVWEDGTMAAVWTRGMEASAFSGRGTAYNFFDGSSWGPWPTERLEDRRCGWPSIAAWGAGEITVAHNGAEGLEWMQRDTKGSGDWTQTNFLGPAGIENDLTWPRMITSGENNEVIHLFVNSYEAYMGQTSTILYSRSMDGGVSWDPHNVILDGMGEDSYLELNADEYVLAAQGNTVVLLVGGAWNDLFYMRTDDNGETWEKHLVWEHPYPMFDWNTTLTSHFFCPARNANVALDPDGKVHVVFGIGEAWHTEVGTSYWLNAEVDGIAYWNEDMEVFGNDTNTLAPPQYGYSASEMIEDVNYIGWMQDVDGDGVVTLNTDIMYYQQFGLSTIPSIGINEFGRIVVIYASTTETYQIDEWNYKHIWMRQHANGSWGEFTDLTGGLPHIFDECYYPVIGKVNGLSLHYIYNADTYPGLAWSEDHEWHQNRIIYGQYDLPVGIDENNAVEELSIQLGPNPATERAMVSLALEDPSDVYVTLSSITGQRVKEASRTNVSGDIRIGIDVSDLPAGTYICTVKAGKLLATEKLIVR